MKRSKYTLLCVAAISFFHLPSWAQSSYFTHTIAQGETVYSIAKIYSVSTQDIFSLNPDAQSGIRAGETLRIPQKTGEQAGRRFHTIASGETLYRITQLYKVSAEAICNANPGLSAENFQAGKVIVIPPGAAPEVVKTEGPDERPRGLANSNCREMHKVARRETLYSIARQYNLTEAELIAANPEMKAPNYKLKKGTFICIPFPQVAPKKQEQPAPTVEFPSKPAAAPMNRIRMGVILPLKEKNSRGAKMVEFYQGLLLAADSVKTQGTSVEIYTFDSGSSPAEVKRVLASPSLAQVDIIFGPQYAGQLPALSDFCKAHKIKLVVPFAPQCDAFYTNPYIYAVTTPKTDQFQAMNEAALARFTNYNHVIVDAQENDKDSQSFVAGLQKALAGQGFTVRTLSVQADEAAMLQALNPFRDNLLIPNSSSIKALNLLFPKLKNFVQAHPEYRISLLGYPEWQTYTASQLTNFYRFNTYIFTSFYRNPLEGRTSLFEKKFQYWFKRSMINSYPRFGMMGFDTGYYFLHGMARYGASFNENLARVQTVPYQHPFQFERVSNWSGFVNKKVRLIHYSPDQTIEIIDIKP